MSLKRGAVAGVILAVLGIGLFIIIYLIMGSAGASQAGRLFGALCIPPAIIGVLLGAYVLIARPGQKPPQNPL